MASEVIQVEDILAKNSQSKSKKNDSKLQYVCTHKKSIYSEASLVKSFQPRRLKGVLVFFYILKILSGVDKKHFRVYADLALKLLAKGNSYGHFITKMK